MNPSCEAADDFQLLQLWANDHSEAAFAELVDRHVEMVYGSALRQVRSPDLAREVAQAVFLLLARKAAAIGPTVILSGWLFRSTSHIAARALRTEVRRRHWEHQTCLMNASSSPEECPTDRWPELKPHLDAALASLRGTDRDALVLRYFENHPVRCIGERLGLSEEAAKKRIQRAVEKLRTVLARKGVLLAAGALTNLLADLPREIPPAELSNSVVAAATAPAPAPHLVQLVQEPPSDLFEFAAPLAAAAAALALLFLGADYLASKTRTAGTPPAPAAAARPPASNVEERTACLSPVPTPGPSRLILAVRSASENRPLAAAIRVDAYRRWAGEVAAADYSTDTNGMVEIPVDGAEIDTLSVWVSSPAHVPVVMSWKGHEFVSPALHHTTRLQPGHLLQGQVVNESGEPVEGAEVTLHIGNAERSRENIGYHPRLSGATTDSQGRFRHDQLPAILSTHRFVVAVQHPDYVRETLRLGEMAALHTNHVIVLKGGLNLRGTVQGTMGNPIAEASIYELSRSLGPDRESKTDYNGDFQLGPFKPGPLRLHLSAKGYRSKEDLVSLSSTTSNVVFRLEESAPTDPSQRDDTNLRVHGTVVDQATGSPIPSFQVVLDERRGAVASLVGEGQNGRFDWPLTMSHIEEFLLEFSSDGYEPVRSDVRKVGGSTEQYFEIRLRRAEAIEGTVVDSQGAPVPGAFVHAEGAGYHALVQEGKAVHLMGNGPPPTSTAADGTFRLDQGIGVEAVLVLHEMGCALVRLANLKNSTIPLQPWAAIEGVVRASGKPSPHQGVTLSSAFGFEQEGDLSIYVQGNTKTDEHGRFRFPKVPPGSVVVARYFNFNRDGAGEIGMSHHQRVFVQPGQTTEIEIGGGGRTIVGQLALSRPVAGFQWSDDLQRLEVSDLRQPQFSGDPSDPGYRDHHRQLQRFWATTPRHFLQIDSDGSFRIEDVATGDYTLTLKVTEPPDPLKENNFSRRSLGRLTKRVIIEDANTEIVDLGTITIPMKD